MKVGIVGGTGNISTPIVRLLLELGHEVVCFNRGERGGVPEDARAVIVDRADEAAFEAKVQAEELDAGIDMICFNRQQAESTIRAFRGVGHVVHCSTVCTYGIEYDWLPVSEDHPLRPISDYGRNKVAADHAFLAAHHADGFPVTIIKPSTTYGPKMGALRQIAWEFSWIDRVRKGKPLVICGDGMTIHQHLHVDDAAPAFVHCLGRETCLGQIYNMVPDGFISWRQHHQLAMKVIGREVELIGVPLDNLRQFEIPAFSLCRDIFAHNGYFANQRVRRDIPEFQPRIDLVDGLAEVIDAMDRDGRIPDSDASDWEDTIIAAQRQVRP